MVDAGETVQNRRDPCTVPTTRRLPYYACVSNALPARTGGGRVGAAVVEACCQLLKSIGGGCWGELDGTTAPGERGGKRTGPSASAVVSGKGRRRRGAEKAGGSGVVRCERLARIWYSCAPAGGNEGGCSTLAVVSTGLVWSTPIVATGGPVPSQGPAKPDKPDTPEQAQSCRPPGKHRPASRAPTAYQ